MGSGRSDLFMHGLLMPWNNNENLACALCPDCEAI